MKHFIYIPGLGDHFDPLRRLVLKHWARDAKVTFVPMRWNDQSETYEKKYERVAKAIDDADGDIVLVGESAGGAMTLLAFSRNASRVSRVLTICGYNHGAADVHPYHKRAHPAFYALMPVVDRLTSDVTRITTIYSTRDHVVTPQHSRINGAKMVELHSPGHLVTISRVLLRPARYVRFLS